MVHTHASSIVISVPSWSRRRGPSGAHFLGPWGRLRDLADFRPATRVLEVSQALVVNFAYIHCTAFVIYTDALKYARVGSISIGCQVGGRWEPHVKTASIDMPASQFATVGTSLSLKLVKLLQVVQLVKLLQVVQLVKLLQLVQLMKSLQRLQLQALHDDTPRTAPLAS